MKTKAKAKTARKKTAKPAAKKKSKKLSKTELKKMMGGSQSPMGWILGRVAAL